MLRLSIVLLTSLFVLAGCITTEERTSLFDPDQIRPQSEVDLPRQQFSWPNVVQLKQEALDIWSQMANDFRFAELDNPAIQAQIAELANKPQSLENRLELSRPYLYHVHQELRNRDMPGEIALLPVIESSYVPTARSSQGAVGLWQFMPETGRNFGLNEDWWHDDKRDPRVSTDAALTYLQSLNDQFAGDWLLTLAAYNAGPYTIERAIKKNAARNKPTDYWSLDLPPETKKYVPRLLALARITMTPEERGLSLPEIKYEPHFDKVEVEGAIDLKKASQLAGVTAEEVLALNAGFKQAVTPPNGKFELLLPKDAVSRFESEYAKLPEEDRISWDRYQVQQGDTLIKIANKHRLNVKMLKQANGLSTHSVKPGQYLMIPLASDVLVTQNFKQSTPKKARTRHVVRKGDSLFAIARNYRVSVKDLIKWNGLSSNALKLGQELLVARDPS